MCRLCIAFLIAFALRASAATHTLDKEKGAAMLEDAAKEGVELNAKPTVNNSVGVTAVLLTHPSVRRLFGAEIADTYAVVQLTISNKNPDAAFVIHGAYIDTSQWALGGGTKGFGDEGRKEPGRADSKSNRIASVESRIARGQLLDAQQWSARNWTVRLLTVLGSVAAGYTFSFKETGIAKGVAAFNGAVVPGVAFAWPDGAVPQQNRISDFGYQTNKVVGKDSGEIIVCFFPIDMFLSTPVRELFLKSPGLFLSPYQILFGAQGATASAGQQQPEKVHLSKKQRLAAEEIQKVIKALNLKTPVVDLQRLHPCYSKAFESPYKKSSDTRPRLADTMHEAIENACRAQIEAKENQQAFIDLDYIGRFGLQNIGVYVDGIMTVDVNTVPAAIDQVIFDGDASKPDFWAAVGERTGALDCRFCQDGSVAILEADKLGITDVKTIAGGSDDRHLKFSFKLTKPIETGQSLTFVVSKTPADPKKSSQVIKSSPFVYTVAYVEVAPKIAKVTVEDKKVTVTGSGFFDTQRNKLAVSLKSDGKDKDVDVTLPAGQAADKLTFNIPSNLAPGCWSVQVKVGEMRALTEGSPDLILSAATPKLTEATRTSDTIAVKGEQLVDTSGCRGQALQFRLLKTGESTPVAVTAKLSPPSEASLSMPVAAKTGDWTVQVLQGADVKSSVKLK